MSNLSQSSIAHLQFAYDGVATGKTLCGLPAREGGVVTLAMWPTVSRPRCKRCQRKLGIYGRTRAEQVVR